MTPFNPEAIGFDPQRLNRLTEWMHCYVDRGKLPNAALEVRRFGQVAYRHQVGYADVTAQTSLPDNPLYRIFSMTKPVTSVAIMQLLEQAKLNLDDPVSAYIPAFTETQVAKNRMVETLETEPLQTPLTLHHLLTHTSGLTYGVLGTDSVAKLYREHKCDFTGAAGSLENNANLIASLPLCFQPGTEWQYGVSVDILGRVLEVIYGQPLDQIFKEQIFNPLSMDDTNFYSQSHNADRLIPLYIKTEEADLTLHDKAGIESHWHQSVDCFSGGGGLVSTLADYGNFIEMLRQGGSFNGHRILSPRTVDMMTSNHLKGDLANLCTHSFSENPLDGLGFGLGFSVNLNPALSRLLANEGEYGWGGFASTTFWIDPVDDLSCCFMTQLIPSDAYPLRSQLRALVYGALVG